MAIPKAENNVPKEPLIFQKSLDCITYKQPVIKIDTLGTNHESFASLTFS